MEVERLDVLEFKVTFKLEEFTQLAHFPVDDNLRIEDLLVDVIECGFYEYLGFDK